LGVGDEGEAENCEDVGVDALAKTIDGSWLPLLEPSEAFIQQIKQKSCLDPMYCNYDVAGEFPGYTSVATACGTHLAEDNFRPDEYACEHYLTTLIENEAGDQELVMVLSYYTYLGGFSNTTCPSMPTFNENDFEYDPNMAGMTRFVLQANDLTDSFDTAGWDCLVPGIN